MPFGLYCIKELMCAVGAQQGEAFEKEPYENEECVTQQKCKAEMKKNGAHN